MLRRKTARFAFAQELFVKRVCFIRRSRAEEARPPSVGRIGKERELAHNENAAVRVADAAVHFSDVVLKNAQREDLIRQLFANRRRIIGRNAEQDQKALPDFALLFSVNRNRCAFYARNNRSHALPRLISVTPGTARTRAKTVSSSSRECT